MFMYASTHPWRSAAGLCGAAGLALAVGLGAATGTGAPALELTSDAVVMPSATPLPAEPAHTELDVPAADDVRAPLPPSSSPSSPSSSASPAEVAEEPAKVAEEPAEVAEEPAEAAEEPPATAEPAAVESAAAPAKTRRPPILGPPMPMNGDMDCADFVRRSFPVDPANDPHDLDRDGDGIACEPPPDE